MKELFIEEVKTEVEQNGINYEYITNYWDIVHKICVRKIRLDKQLEIGKLYAFNYVDNNNDDTYHYIVLKIEDSNVYYIAEYYDGLISTKENYLVENTWVKCNMNERGVNLKDYKMKC